MDRRFQTQQRRARIDPESGGVELLRARLQSGDLDENLVRLAGTLGLPEARAITGVAFRVRGLNDLPYLHARSPGTAWVFVRTASLRLIAKHGAKWLSPISHKKITTLVAQHGSEGLCLRERYDWASRGYRLNGFVPQQLPCLCGDDPCSDGGTYIGDSGQAFYRGAVYRIANLTDGVDEAAAVLDEEIGLAVARWLLGGPQPSVD